MTPRRPVSLPNWPSSEAGKMDLSLEAYRNLENSPTASSPPFPISDWSPVYVERRKFVRVFDSDSEDYDDGEDGDISLGICPLPDFPIGDWTGMPDETSFEMGSPTNPDDTTTSSESSDDDEDGVSYEDFSLDEPRRPLPDFPIGDWTGMADQMSFEIGSPSSPDGSTTNMDSENDENAPPPVDFSTCTSKLAEEVASAVLKSPRGRDFNRAPGSHVSSKNRRPLAAIENLKTLNCKSDIDDKHNQGNGSVLRHNSSIAGGVKTFNIFQVFSYDAKLYDKRPWWRAGICESAPYQPPKGNGPSSEEDVMLVYDSTIYPYLKELELKFRASLQYFKVQKCLTAKMRNCLVDWMVEAGTSLDISSAAISQAVSYLDRFLTEVKSKLKVEKFQLLGAVCLAVAEKYEDDQPPKLSDLICATDHSYTIKQANVMEMVLLKVLGGYLGTPTIHYFIRRLCYAVSASRKACLLAQYIGELALVDVVFLLSHPPSRIGAAAVLVAIYVVDKRPWADQEEMMSGYSFTHLRSCTVWMIRQLQSPFENNFFAVYTKYNSEEFEYIAAYPVPG